MMWFRNLGGPAADPCQPMWLKLAQRQGWVPSPLAKRDPEPSLWLVVVLMVLLSLCALAVLGLVVVLVLDVGEPHESVFYVLAAALWSGALVSLRHPRTVLAQCMATVAVLVALGVSSATAVGINEWPVWLVCLVQGAALLGTAAWLRPRWVATLFSAGGVVCLLVGLSVDWLGRADLGPQGVQWWVWLMCASVAMGLAAWAWRESRGLDAAGSAHRAACWEGVCVGLLLALLTLDQLPAYLSMGDDTWSSMRWLSILAMLLSATALGVLKHRWMQRSRADALLGLPARVKAEAVPLWGLMLVAVLASAAKPWLALVVVVAVLVALTARWRMLAATGLVALWMLSRFYHDLQWPLDIKAAMLAGLGLVLLLTLGVQKLLMSSASSRVTAEPVRSSGLAVGDATQASAQAPSTTALASVILGVLACLALLNVDVMRKETVVREGESLLVALAPVDPRSLMQGDYVDLRFEVPQAVREALHNLPDLAIRRHAHVVVQVQAHKPDAGRAQLSQARIVRLAREGESLADNERLMPLKHLKSEWVLVTDAYFLPEGQGARFEQARWGEFRLLPDGRALLVGLSDAQGQPIASPTDLRTPMW